MHVSQWRMQLRYIVAVLNLISQEPLYPKEGAGGVGIIEIVLMGDQSFGANVKIKAERFVWKDSEDFVSQL